MSVLARNFTAWTRRLNVHFQPPIPSPCLQKRNRVLTHPARLYPLASRPSPPAPRPCILRAMAEKTKTLTALDYLANPAKWPARPVCAAFGNEAFLRRQTLLALRAAVLGGDDADFSLTTFDGGSVSFRDVHEVLSTIAMFGGGQRLAIVEDADAFVTRYRPQLEDYVAKPSRSGVLVLDLETLPSNTRLYKSIAAGGLLVDCAAPTPARLSKWLLDWAKQRHHAQIAPAAADMLTEMIGPELGLLDQEIAKLALMVGKDEKISPELVGKSVGGWRAKTTWDMLDAALDGHPQEAMSQLDRLLASGEQPVGLLGQIAASLRRLAAATRLIVQAENAKRRIGIREALEQVGVRSFVLQKTERQLRHLGRRRGLLLNRWLLQADLDLKGESKLPPRLVLERLIVRLAAPPEPKNKE
jgi:DNA polymerase III subunit delta